MADNSFSSTVASLFKGMDSFITTKTVVGDAVHIGDTIILPLVDVSLVSEQEHFPMKRRTTAVAVWEERSLQALYLSSRMVPRN